MSKSYWGKIINLSQLPPESSIKESFDHVKLRNFTVKSPNFDESEGKRKGRSRTDSHFVLEKEVLRLKTGNPSSRKNTPSQENGFLYSWF